MSPTQIMIIGDGCRGEERDFFFDKLSEYADRVRTMPKTYEQDGKGLDAIAYLHYFNGGADWYITEKDKAHSSVILFQYENSLKKKKHKPKTRKNGLLAGKEILSLKRAEERPP